MFKFLPLMIPTDSQKGVVVKGGDMRGLEKEIVWLRPFVDSNAWDYCVVWKLGDDPSRFIEWVGCCCGGGGGYECGDVKLEIGEENYQLGPLCRDFHIKHPIRTKACEALANFPSSMPLYSGIHGEVVITNQPRWVNHVNVADSNPSSESVGTRALIPVFGGLIELFTAKHMAKDQKIVELIKNHFNVPLKQEAAIVVDYSNVTLHKHTFDPLLEENLQKLRHSNQLSSNISWMPVLFPSNNASTNPSFEGSSSGSIPSNEVVSFDSYDGCLPQDGQLKQSIGKPSVSRKNKHNEHVQQEQMGLLSDFNKKVKVVKVMQRSESDSYRSKNLLTERNRRQRIREGLYALRALVPNISKMDKQSTLGDAIDYISKLQNEVKKLNEELEDIEEEDNRRSSTELKIVKKEALHDQTTRHMPRSENNQGSPDVGEKKNSEVQVEVNQIGKREFLIKLFCKQKRGGFGRLMDSINTMGLQVVNANITTSSGSVMNVLTVEAHKKDIQAKRLRDSLIELTR